MERLGHITRLCSQYQSAPGHQRKLLIDLLCISDKSRIGVNLDFSFTNEYLVNLGQEEPGEKPQSQKTFCPWGFGPRQAHKHGIVTKYLKYGIQHQVNLRAAEAYLQFYIHVGMYEILTNYLSMYLR